MNVTIRHDYRPLLGPVRDQGARPTCLAHASTPRIMALLGIGAP